MDADNPGNIALDDFRSIIASSVDGFILVNTHGNIIYTNDSYCQMIGYSREELLAMHMSDVDALDSDEDVAKRTEEIIHNGSLRFVTKHLHKSSSAIDVEVTANYSPQHGGSIFSFVRNITQQKQTEELYQHIVENQTEFVDRYLPGGILTYINPALARFTGVDADELLGKSFYPFLHEDDREETIRRIESINIHNPIVETESRIVLPDGTVRWNRWTHTGFFDENGTLIDYQSVGRDITERKFAEEELQKSEAMLKLAQQCAGAGCWDWDMATGKLIWTDDFFKLFGLDPGTQEASFDLWQKVVHPDDYETASNNIKLAIESGHQLFNEYRVVLPDGKIRWISALGNTVYDPTGKPIRMSGICIDITERKQAEEELRESESRFKGAFQHSAIGMGLVSPEGKWLKVNNALCKMLGYTEEELLTKTFQDITHPDDMEADLNFVRQMLTGEIETYTMEKRYFHKQGHIVWILLAVSLVRDINNAPLYFISQVEDITERKNAEDALIDSEQRYRVLSETMLQGVVHQDASGTIIAMNPAAECILGKTREEFLGRSSVSEEHHTIQENGEPFHGTEHPAMIALQTGQPVSNVVMGVYNPKRGEYRWIIIGAVPIFRTGETTPSEVFTVFEDITEQKKTEFALKKSEYFFKESQKCAFIGSYLANFIADNWESSEILDSIFGIDKDYDRNVQGWLNIVHPDDKEMMARHLKEDVIANQKPFAMEYRIIRNNDGETRWVNGLGTAEFDKDGNVTTLMGTIQDITERKNAEQAVRESKELLAEIIRLSPISMAIVCLDGTIEQINQRAVETFGYLSDDIPNMERWWLQAYPDDSYRAEVIAQWMSLVEKALVEKCEIPRQEYRVTCKDGTVKTMNIFGIPVLNKVFVMFEDITEQKNAEYALLASKNLLQTIINTVPMRVFWKDMELRYLGCNLAFAKDAGVLHPDDLIGKDDFQLGWREQADLYRNDDRSVMESGLPKLSYDEPQTTPDGNQIWLRTSKVPLIAEKNQSIGILGIYEDVTNWKKAEQEKLDLEHQLLHTQKLESLGVLAGGIAHDFNNILAIIIGHCSLALMDDETADKHIPPIEKAAERAAGLCRQMLAYAGKEQFVMKKVNIGELISEMVTMLKATINQNVAIMTHLITDLIPVKADANQIRQVVMNLILNASEAIGDAQGEVHVSLTKVSVAREQREKDHLGKLIPPGCYACLEVTDNGCGMTEETKRRIFEPFYTTKFTGRGLGMSAVLGIITAHKGALQLFSEPGKGTIFKVYLPIQVSDCGGAYAQQHAIHAEAWRGSGTVLLVEDEVVIMPIARAMLQKLGFSTIEAYNGKEALELYQKYSTDITLVVTDIGMPVMDGYALTRELKKLAPKLPIVISSGFGEGVVNERFASGDIAGTVSKPYNIDQMQKVLKDVMDSTN